MALAIDYSGLLNNYVLPTVATTLLTALGGVLAWGVKKANTFFTDRHMANMAALDQRASDAIMKAAQNGANAAIARARMAAPDEKIAVTNTLVDKVGQHIVDSVPDSLARFGVTQQRLNTLALSAVNQALGPAPAKTGS